MSLESALERAYKTVARNYEGDLSEVSFLLEKDTTEARPEVLPLPSITLTATAQGEIVPHSGVFEVELKIEVTDAVVRETGTALKLDALFYFATRPLRYRNLPAMISAAAPELNCYGMPMRGEGSEYNAGEGTVTRSATALFICRSIDDGPALPPPDPFATLNALDAAGKVVCAWTLPLNPTQYLTISGSNVTQWNASHGSHKVHLSELTNPPQWVSSLYGGKGGVTFDGTAQILTGLTAPTGWPGDADDCYMLAAVRQDADGADASPTLRNILSYGAGASTARAIARVSSVGVNHTRLIPGINGPTGAADFSGSHTVGGIIRIGGAYDLYFDGALDATDATATAGLTLTLVKMGGVLSGAPKAWKGVIVAVAVLNDNATLQNFLDLEAEFRARIH